MENVVNSLPSWAEGKELENRKLYNVALADLGTDPNQPRKHFDEQAMGEMVESIKKHDVLQPVIFRRDEQGNFIIVSGERRFRASKDAGKETIPGIYYDEDNKAEIALVENLLREDLTPIEEAEALAQLQREQGYSNEKLKEVIGKASSTISEILSLNKLPEKIKSECREVSTYSRRMLVEIARVDSPDEMVKLFEKAKNFKLKSDTVRAQKGEKVSPAEALRLKVEKFHNTLNKADFDSFGDELTKVENELKYLVSLIEKKISVKEAA